MATYEYTEVQFLNNKADLAKLTKQVRASAITSATLEYINYEPGYKVWFVFDGDLSPADQAALDVIVGAHDGEPLVFVEGTNAESIHESVTSSGEFVRKLVLLPGELESGTYRIHFYCEVANTNTAGRTEVRICKDGECFAQPSVEVENRDDWLPFTGFKVVEVDETGINEIVMEYRRLNKGSAKIRHAKLELFKMRSI